MVLCGRNLSQIKFEEALKLKMMSGVQNITENKNLSAEAPAVGCSAVLADGNSSCFSWSDPGAFQRLPSPFGDLSAEDFVFLLPVFLLHVQQQVPRWTLSSPREHCICCLASFSHSPGLI